VADIETLQFINNSDR